MKKKDTATIIINTDGASRGNPGAASAGAVLSDDTGVVHAREKKTLGTMTNNEAEYEAVLLGLNAAKRVFGTARLKESSVELRLDSQLIARQLNGDYQIKESRLFPYYIAVHNIRVSTIPNLVVTHVRREENKAADALANEALDEGGQGGLL